MEEKFKELTERLMQRNQEFTVEQARTWVESLWEDFEATYAKAGRKYRGPETTEAVVIKWIDQYGPYLHRYEPGQKKFSHLNE
ncbi:YfhJ family protein [Alkalicoccobacillus porphyridii]|uniref:WVELL protein n=1 Tax=Alkalicoccobacillus porphyridii TaxID=2597270 RepID=A0A553ZV57_9BACI|nr:YfhJ family protein [Alkalicoccobacillus porphyridii]TSB45196.1 hypothetical protein FN960_17170 [Alkalicoccobacillus porphyridii]